MQWKAIEKMKYFKENEIKGQKGGCFGILMGTLVASLLRNMLTGDQEGTIRGGDNIRCRLNL